MKRLLSILFILLVFTPAFVTAENIRGEVVESVVLGDKSSSGENSFSMGIEDIFAVSFEKNTEFLTGFEIEIKVPSTLRNYSSSFAFNIYKQISPEISSGIGTYYGRKYHSLFLPEAARFFIRIPYEQKLPGENGPYTTVVSTPAAYTDSPLMFTVLPMMKGFPSSLYNSSFTVSVNPLFKDSGELQLSFEVPDGLNQNELVCRIDGSAVSGSPSSIKLASGSHSLSVEIPGGKNVTKSFSIRRGETTSLKIEIEKLESYARIDVPENTVIYMDGERLELAPDGRVKLEPGEHNVLFKLADYKISKKFDIQPGKDCKISLFLDIFIEEN